MSNRRGVADPAGGIRLPAVLALVLLAAGCSNTTPGITTGPPVLNVENRGGPSFRILIDGVVVATVGCVDGGGGATLVPGQGGVPKLPWDLSVVRVRDGKVELTEHVDALPRWLFQLGGDFGPSLGTEPVAGPPGPTCPPSG